jgi:hypothetical protein
VHGQKVVGGAYACCRPEAQTTVIVIGRCTHVTACRALRSVLRAWPVGMQDAQEGGCLTCDGSTGWGNARQACCCRARTNANSCARHRGAPAGGYRQQLASAWAQQRLRQSIRAHTRHELHRLIQTASGDIVGCFPGAAAVDAGRTAVMRQVRPMINLRHMAAAVCNAALAHNTRPTCRAVRPCRLSVWRRTDHGCRRSARSLVRKLWHVLHDYGSNHPRFSKMVFRRQAASQRVTSLHTLA